MRVLTIDDHGMFRHGLRLTLQQQFTDVEVLEAATIDQGMALVEQSAPIDLALIDLFLAGEDGVDAFQRLRIISPDTPAAALTASEDVNDVTRVMAAGAMGYIKKTFGPDVLKNVIQLILSGERFYPVVPVDSAPLGGVRSDLAEAARQPTADGAVELTPRQKDILHGLVNGRSNKEIARDLNIIEGTVKAHIRNMMGKLRVRNRTQLALMATRLGFIDEKGRWRN